jgi:phosphoglycolate phosphatase
MDGHNYRLIIFDWDGTLSDSAAMIVSAMQAAIAALDLPPRSDTDIRELIGLSLNDGLKILYPEMETLALRALLDSYRGHWLADGQTEAPLFAGAQAALGRLAAQGCQLAVATGKSRRGLDRSLQYHRDLAELMQATRTADETADKPNPLMLEELLAEFRLRPGEALMVGDTEYDMAMAAAIGMPAVAVTCGVHPPARLRAAARPLALLPDVAALPDWLAQGRG